MTISFDAWKEGKAASTTHELAVVRPKSRPKPEPVSPALVASLAHPDEAANVWKVMFNKDGSKLFTAGYPSGIVQVWDVEKRKELRKVESPRGYRGSADYALVTPDWKTLYVPVESRKVKRTEKDGKKAYRFECRGEVRAWDLTTGKSLPAIKPAEEHAPANARLSPDGAYLVCIERPSSDSDDTKPDQTVLVTLATGKRTVLCSRYGSPAFSRDGKKLALAINDYEGKKSAVRLFDPASGKELAKLALAINDYEGKKSAVRLYDLTSGKELAKLDCPEKERHFSATAFSLDGALLAVNLGGKKGADREVWFLDGKTLARRARYTAKGDPEQHGWGGGGFTPDGKRYYVFAGEGVDVWDVKDEKVVRSIKCGWPRPPWQSAVSADGKYLAAGWAPKDEDGERGPGDPDPRDLPQPRVSVIDLTGEAKPRVLIAPHGYVGGLAFSPDGKKLAFGGAGAVHLFDLTKK